VVAGQEYHPEGALHQDPDHQDPGRPETLQMTVAEGKKKRDTQMHVPFFFYI
jgi:hypothetical protein